MDPLGARDVDEGPTLSGMPQPEVLILARPQRAVEAPQPLECVAADRHVRGDHGSRVADGPRGPREAVVLEAWPKAAERGRDDRIGQADKAHLECVRGLTVCLQMGGEEG